MSSKYRQIRDQVVAQAGQIFTSAVRSSMNPEKAGVDAQRVRDKYHGLPRDALADIMIKRAARKTKWEGAANGLGVTTCEILVATPVPEPIHKVAAGTGMVALLLGDMAYTTRIQMQLLLAIADLYGASFERDDEEDVYTVFKAALGLKGTERVRGCGLFIFTETARKQFRKLLRTGIRRAVQDRVIKVAGKRIGRYLGEKYVMRLIPVVNAGIGYAFNSRMTKSVGRWAKIKAKIRSLSFEQMKRIEEEDPEAKLWILPLIFYVGTADDKLTENVLTLYSQANKRLQLSAEQHHQVEAMIDSEELSRIFAEKLPRIVNERVRKALFNLSVTTVAVNLKPQRIQDECLVQLARYLKVEYNQADLSERVRYLKR
ncbi:MAG: EcsC family protein [bacterium]|nr:EcsC family protein [bacterium]